MFRLTIAQRVPGLASVMIKRGVLRGRSRSAVRMRLARLTVIGGSVVRMCYGQGCWLLVQWQHRHHGSFDPVRAFHRHYPWLVHVAVLLGFLPEHRVMQVCYNLLPRSDVAYYIASDK